MKIIIDAMGGDNAPGAFVEGAFAAAKEYGAEIVLVGRGETLLRAMKEHGYETLPDGVEITDAEDTVQPEDDPANIVHSRRNSSMVLGLKLLSEGVGDAFISAGCTGALLSAATLLVKRVKGIRRAAFGPVTPTKTGQAVIIDAGANAECQPEFLLQFGCMGSFYAKSVLKIEAPRVGLLNNGTESGKGTALHRQAYELLKAAGDKGILHFVGNIEARDVPLGTVDVAVCDGFSGNVLLKSIEGTAMFMASYMKKMFSKNLFSKLGYLLCKSGVRDFKSLLDYRNIGGTMLVGISKPVLKAHGASDALAVKNAVKQAMLTAEAGICQSIADNIDLMTISKELSLE